MKFFIKSYGCQMNTYDSNRMADLLREAGYTQTENAEEADIAIFNTCSIREKADEKLFSDLGRIRPFKDAKNGKMYIIVTGCVAQLRTQDIMRRTPYVDIILGPQDIQAIVEKLQQKIAGHEQVITSTSLGAIDKFQKLSCAYKSQNVSEFLTIQEGCDNFCTYCVVPFTRGREFSRDVESVLKEARELVASGVQEIVLLGQNVNSYDGTGPDGKQWNLARLLFEIADVVPGLKRLRYTTSNPKDITDDLGAAHRDIDILMPFIHLPVQSGSDIILKKMNRKYTSDEYLKKVDLLRKYRPDIAFSSDFIVGFPGETDEDFAQTIQIVEQVQYSQAYSFKYSPRPNTAAARMDNQIDESIKSERLQILQDLLNSQQSQFNASYVGKHLSVLFEKSGKYENQLVGRSEYSQAVSVCDNNIKIGDIATVLISEAVSHSLIGKLV